MKRLHFSFIAAFSLAVLLAAGCGATSKTPAEMTAEEKQAYDKVGQLLDSRNYKVEVNYMLPRRGPGKALTDRYSIVVADDVVDSHLPYAGVAQTVPYGGGKGLTFKDKIEKYTDSGWKNGVRQVVFTTDNGEDVLTYTLRVFNDGTTDVQVESRNRDGISYRGQLSEPDSRTE